MKKKQRRNEPAASTLPAPLISVWMWPVVIAMLFWVVVVMSKFNEKFPININAFFQLLDGFTFSAWGSFFDALVRNLKSAGLILILDAAVFGWGSRLLPSDENELGPLERFALSMGIGFACVSMILFLLGVAGFFDRSSLWVFYGIFCAGGIWTGRLSLMRMIEAVRSYSVATLFASPLNWALFILAGVAITMAFVPELFYDALVYHVGLPQMYVNEGRLVDTPNVYFSRFPMFLHMLYVLGIGLDGSSLAKLFNTTLMFVSIATLISISRRFGWGRGAVWAPLIVLSMPVFQYNVWSTAVDAGLSCYTVLTLLAFFIWQRHSERPWRWFVLFAVFAGSVFSIKYTGVLVVLAYGAVICASKRASEAWTIFARRLCVFGLVVTALMAPWLIRNTLWTGNPVYPLMPKQFESREMNLAKINSEEGAVAHSAPRTLSALLAFPWTQTMREISNFNFIGPFILAALPLLLFIRWKHDRNKILLAILVAVYFMMALHFSGDIRYLMPGFFLLSILLAGGISTLIEKSRFIGWTVQASFLLVILYHIMWVFQYAQLLYQPGPVLTGQLTRDAYASKIHGGLNMCPWNSMIADLTKLPDSSRVYILGNEQVFGFPKRFWYSSCHDNAPLVEWANSSANAEAFYQKLSEEKFTHILINAPEAMRLKNYSLFEWSSRGRAVFKEFGDKHLQLVNIKPVDEYPNALFLFEIKKEATPTQIQFSRYFKNVLFL